MDGDESGDDDDDESSSSDDITDSEGTARLTCVARKKKSGASDHLLQLSLVPLDSLRGKAKVITRSKVAGQVASATIEDDTSSSDDEPLI